MTPKRGDRVVERCYFDEWLGRTRLFVDVDGRGYTSTFFTVEDDLVSTTPVDGAVGLW